MHRISHRTRLICWGVANCHNTFCALCVAWNWIIVVHVISIQHKPPAAATTATTATSTKTTIHCLRCTQDQTMHRWLQQHISQQNIRASYIFVYGGAARQTVNLVLTLIKCCEMNTQKFHSKWYTHILQNERAIHRHGQENLYLILWPCVCVQQFPHHNRFIYNHLSYRRSCLPSIFMASRETIRSE